MMFLLGLLNKRNLLDRLLDRTFQILHIDRLGSEVESTMVHGSTNILHIPISRYDDTFQGRVTHLVNLRQQCQAIHLRHIDIAQYDIKVRMVQHHPQCLQTIMGKGELILSLTDLPTEILG